MEEKIDIIKYEPKDNKTLTKCPKGDNSNVGSCGCKICPYFLSIDYEKKEVRCYR